jgi:DNA-binding MarR family transcriptional regulator
LPDKVTDRAAVGTDELADALIQAFRTLAAVTARSLADAPNDLTQPQFRMLVVLAQHGPQRPSDLASELNIGGSSVTRTCDRLVKKRLVKRTPRRDNRRELLVDITDEGREIVLSVTKARQREVRKLITRIPAERRVQLLEALREFSGASIDDTALDSSLAWPL